MSARKKTPHTPLSDINPDLPYYMPGRAYDEGYPPVVGFLVGFEKRPTSNQDMPDHECLRVQVTNPTQAFDREQNATVEVRAGSEIRIPIGGSLRSQCAPLRQLVGRLVCLRVKGRSRLGMNWRWDVQAHVAEAPTPSDQAPPPERDLQPADHEAAFLESVAAIGLERAVRLLEIVSKVKRLS